MALSNRSRILPTAVVAFSAIATLALAGCSAPEPAPASSGASAETVTLRLAPQAITDFAPIWLGIEQGIFEDAGIEIELVEGGASSAAQVPLLLSGTADIAATTAAAALQAAGQRLDVTIVGGLTTFADSDDLDQSGLVVAAGTEISGDFADLEGMTIAISGLKSVSEAVISAAVEEAGGDPTTISYIQGPMPTLGDLVATGGADAAFVIDPFLTLAVADGLEVFGHPFPIVAPGVPGTSIVASTAFAEANPEAITRFQAALELAVAYATEHPDEVVTALSEEAEIPAEMLVGMKNPTFNAVVDPDDLVTESEMLAKYGALEGDVDASTLVFSE